MKEIVEKYLKEKYKNYEHIELNNFYIDGALCVAEFYYDAEHYYKEKELISVWDMITFIYDLKYEKYKIL